MVRNKKEKKKSMKKEIRKENEKLNSIDQKLTAMKDRYNMDGSRKLKTVNKEVKKVKKKLLKPVTGKVLATGNSTQVSQAIANYITNPFSFPAVRFGNLWSSQAVAVAKPWTIQDIELGDDGDYVSATRSVMFVFRDPLRGYITYKPNTAPYTYLYRFIAPPDQDEPSGPTDSITISQGYVGYPNVAFFECNSVNNLPHGEILYCGRDNTSDRRYAFMMAGTVVTCVVNNPIETDCYVFCRLDLYANGQIFENQYAGEMVATDEDATINVETTGYYALSIEVVGAQSETDLSVSFAHSGGVWSHNPIPHWIENEFSVESTRIVTASVLATNTTPELVLGGQVTMGQFPKGKDWLPLWLDNSRGDLSKLPYTKTINAKLGGYTYLKPSGPEDLDFLTPTNTVNGALISTTYAITPNFNYLGVVFQVPPNTSETSFAGIWTLCFGLEFTTLDTWREIYISELTSKDWEAAFEILKNAPQFLENPVHFKTLVNYIKRGIQKGAKFIYNNRNLIAQGAKFISEL